MRTSRASLDARRCARARGRGGILALVRVPGAALPACSRTGDGSSSGRATRSERRWTGSRASCAAAWASRGARGAPREGSAPDAMAASPRPGRRKPGSGRHGPRGPRPRAPIPRGGRGALRGGDGELQCARPHGSGRCAPRDGEPGYEKRMSALRAARRAVDEDEGGLPPRQDPLYMGPLARAIGGHHEEVLRFGLYLQEKEPEALSNGRRRSEAHLGRRFLLDDPRLLRGRRRRDRQGVRRVFRRQLESEPTQHAIRGLAQYPGR